MNKKSEDRSSSSFVFNGPVSGVGVMGNFNTIDRIIQTNTISTDNNNVKTMETKEQEHARLLQEIMDAVKNNTKLDPDAISKVKEIEKALYGPDRRNSVLNFDNPAVQQNKECVVSLWRKRNVNITSDPAFLECRPFTEVFSEFHQELKPLSPKDSFYGENCGAFGSGLYVRTPTSDIVITAGHNIKPEGGASNIKDIYFIFGWTHGKNEIPAADVFEGTLIDYSVGSSDYAIVELKGKVNSNRPSAKLREAGKISDGQQVYIIGHPCGLSMKIADRGQVKANIDPNVFTANLDAFGGNSGSPVFNSDNHLVEGILVKGNPDFIWNSKDNVMEARIYPTTGLRGEVCLRVTLEEIRAQLHS